MTEMAAEKSSSTVFSSAFPILTAIFARLLLISNQLINQKQIKSASLSEKSRYNTLKNRKTKYENLNKQKTKSRKCGLRQSGCHWKNYVAGIANG